MDARTPARTYQDLAAAGTALEAAERAARDARRAQAEAARKAQADAAAAEERKAAKGKGPAAPPPPPSFVTPVTLGGGAAVVVHRSNPQQGLGAGKGRLHGMGKGKKGLGRGGAVRHRKVLRDGMSGITKPALRRLARRGGVKRMSGLVYDSARDALRDFLEEVLRDTIIYTEHAVRRTISAMDVVYALKRKGRTLYGFGG